ncbi:conserved protein of unknown function (plasmid) [Cupriavidus neocaledonicus]|uniref:Uncharacterized protein n=1 Tax=Cupriavidus neocaledonicus TaxID=1040979 RepID=A0A375HX58_9BURK|nr:conserved hypothetical protein [Cupriavidus neocaledonicus]SPD61240.1 conserved protein of unknown function [Cupriavidus neocaledonicus]
MSCLAWQRVAGGPPSALRRHSGAPVLAFAASRGRRAGLLPTNQRMNEYQPSAYCRFSAP